MNPRQAAALMLRDPESFAHAGGRPLRPYQLDVARAVVASVLGAHGDTFTVMFARQMGKNELSALIEAYLLALFSGQGGQIVKAAPSFKPQIVNSILRLKETLSRHPLTAGRWHPTFGYMVTLNRASVAFFSADPSSNVVGATAGLLLEIDEAQDVDPEKYDRDFRPMASSTNATTVLYGTAWNQDSLLERVRRRNLALESTLGRRLHFEYDWTHLAALNPAYDAFVQAEMARLGAGHPSFRTQYLLQTMQDAGRLFSEEQRRALQGMHARAPEPEPGRIYVAGVDVAGEDEEAADAAARALHPRRDSTVITIARVEHGVQPRAEIVEHLWWTGRDQVWQYDALVQLWQRWNFARVSIDASGIGHGLAQFLERRYPDRTDAVLFTAASKSKLAYDLLATINTGRIAVYKVDDSAESAQFWREITACRYTLRAHEQLRWGVPDHEGHDDFAISLALCARALQHLTPPATGTLVRATGDGSGRW